MAKNLKSQSDASNDEYFRPSVAVDGVVLTIANSMEEAQDAYINQDHVSPRVIFGKELKVLLIKRGAVSEDGTKRPYFGYWALPGGFLRSSENAESALKRELLEEAMIYLNQKNISLHQIGFYSDPKRDEYNFDSKNPSFHKQIMSVAYAAILNEDVIPFSGSDAVEAEYFFVKDILNKKIEKKRLAFDHNLILDDAIKYISEKMKFTPIALDFLEEEFTIGEIRSVYEAIWSVNEDLDNIDLSNFHKKVLNQTDQDGNNVILPSPQSKNKKRKQPGKGAPAKLYIRNEKSREFSLVMSPTKKRQ
jgi:8-oxo-dGTP diphosphatase